MVDERTKPGVGGTPGENGDADLARELIRELGDEPPADALVFEDEEKIDVP